MQQINTPAQSDLSNEEIKLPLLSLHDIKKLDHLLSYMKENKNYYINIHSVCKVKWGNDRLLYFSFAEYLKTNSFTMVKNHNGDGKYIWNQMISARGLALDSFKNEYIRQREKKNNEVQGKHWYQLNGFMP